MAPSQLGSPLGLVYRRLGGKLKIKLMAIVALSTMALTGCSSTTPSQKTEPAVAASEITISGIIIADARTISFESESCGFSVPAGNFSGKKITVKDDAGKIIALHTIAPGTLNSYRNDKGLAMACNFPFTIEDVPKSDFYEIDFAGKNSMTYTLKQVTTGLKVRYRTEINTP